MKGIFRWAGQEQLCPRYCPRASRHQASAKRQVRKPLLWRTVTSPTVKAAVRDRDSAEVQAALLIPRLSLGEGPDGLHLPRARPVGETVLPAHVHPQCRKRTGSDNRCLPFPAHTACQSLRTHTHTISSAASFSAVEKHLERTKNGNRKTGKSP